MNILLLNGGKAFGHSHGELNAILHNEAKTLLSELGHQVQETHIDAGYDIETEIEKYLWADAVIYQMPGWWMGEPWIVKKYMDEVFTIGHGKLYQSDGRHRVNPTEGYGTGGLLQGRKHMLSLTWNAPIEAFTREGDFFNGVGVDGVYLHFHKANEFLGFTSLPTFICNDVIKSPNVPEYLANYRQHLIEVLAKLNKLALISFISLN
ncbi:NAD(P)H-dependent oxidoreductase [Avibacterium paragallinarum]|uniref:Modulator of drug activity B n=1 Tax=Avibacterium paragallinarum TaxID=728 RepID=A0A380X5Y4_AVIPA|nr:NAD(P)H-dependent oxidoreductase [Avibacterium paragallinarum]SUU98685.1 Modulator of drug activity B [Avibacterium paragallinarum]